MKSADHRQLIQVAGPVWTMATSCQRMPEAYRQRLAAAFGTAGAIAAFGIACAVAAIAGAYAAGSAKQKSVAENPRHTARVRIMQEHLATQSGPFIILAGDSHAELLNWDRICGKPVVNLGLSGVATAHYGQILARLAPTARAEAMVIFLGTNDLALEAKPGSGQRLADFADRFGAVVRDSRRFASRTVYVPLFPGEDDPRATRVFDTGSIARYRQAATGACRNGGCKTLDLDRVAMSTTEDGVHANRANRRAGGDLHALIEQELCPNRQGRAVFFTGTSKNGGQVP